MSTTRRRKYALIPLVIVAAAGCLALGWWQWSRYESTSGTFQNLGYALQWPMFAGFCVYAYRKFVRYEEAPPEQPSTTGAVTEIPAGLLPERPTAPRQPDIDDPVAITRWPGVAPARAAGTRSMAGTPLRREG